MSDFNRRLQVICLHVLSSSVRRSRQCELQHVSGQGLIYKLMRDKFAGHKQSRVAVNGISSPTLRSIAAHVLRWPV